MSSSIAISSESEEEEQQEVPDTLFGSGEYQIVGIRYYNGVAHPGEFVTLVREPHNPYDRNAIRVDNLVGEKVGHIKATMAKSLASIMDNGNARLEGTIPRAGNAYTLPLVLDFYSNNAISGEAGTGAAAAAENLRAELRRRGDYQFNLSSEFAGTPKSAKKSAKVEVVRKKMDWNHQQKALDEMFDKQLKELYKDLPDIAMPNCLVGITLMPYQVKGIQWLIKKETNASPAPFYKKVREKGKIDSLISSGIKSISTDAQDLISHPPVYRKPSDDSSPEERIACLEQSLSDMVQHNRKANDILCRLVEMISTNAFVSATIQDRVIGTVASVTSSQTAPLAKSTVRNTPASNPMILQVSTSNVDDQSSISAPSISELMTPVRRKTPEVPSSSGNKTQSGDGSESVSDTSTVADLPTPDVLNMLKRLPVHK